MKFSVNRNMQVMMQSRILTLRAGTYETSDKTEIEKLKSVEGIEEVKAVAKKKT